MIRRAPVAIAAFALLAGAVTLHAQTVPARHDNNAPIDWEADRIEVQDRDHRATLIGSVRVVQQEMTITADRMIANYVGSLANGGAATPGQPAPSGGKPATPDGGKPAKPDGGKPAKPDGGKPKVQRLDANGHVVVTRPGEIAHGNYGIYDLETRIVTLIGNVSLDRNGSVVHGGRLVIDQNTNRATVDGSAIGGAGPAGKGGRVSGRFIVDQTGGTPAAPKK